MFNKVAQLPASLLWAYGIFAVYSILVIIGLLRWMPKLYQDRAQRNHKIAIGLLVFANLEYLINGGMFTFFILGPVALFALWEALKLAPRQDDDALLRAFTYLEFTWLCAYGIFIGRDNVWPLAALPLVLGVLSLRLALPFFKKYISGLNINWEEFAWSCACASLCMAMLPIYWWPYLEDEVLKEEDD